MSEPLASISPDSVTEKLADVAPPPLRMANRPGGRQPSLAASNKYTDKAKQLVVDNYNAHHDKDKTPPLTMDLVYVVWFSKVLDNWKAIIGSVVVKNLLYEVTYNGSRSEAYVDVYKKINNVRIAD